MGLSGFKYSELDFPEIFFQDNIWCDILFAVIFDERVGENSHDAVLAS
jgi:hypothetical protein